MRRWEKAGRQGGFSLVEILVVMAIMGVVTMAVYSLYQTNQKTATTQDNVVELQQNLRIALDRMERDIRMAGFMVPSSTTPLSAATATSLTLQTASAVGRIARVAANFSSPVDATTSVTITVASADMARLFANGDRVRIIRPPNQSQPISNPPFTVTGVNPSGPTIDLSGFSSPGINYKAGDVIVRTTAGAPDPNTVTYALGASPNNDQLIRTANSGTPDIVADGLTTLGFTYLLDNGTHTPTPSNLSQIKAVEIDITGQAFSQDGPKTREIRGLVTIKNR
jgi:prepilin-type N-terminal cleavage/methylation domain-containing protein